MGKNKNIRKKYYVINLLCIIFLILTVLIAHFLPVNNDCKSVEKIIKGNDEVTISSNSELKAVWVTFMDLDMKGSNYTKEEFKKKFDAIVDNCKKFGLTDLITHIRPFGDALYNSKYFPTSHIIVGEQGKELNFDPLKYMIEKVHKENLKFHALINPFRIQLNNCPKNLADGNYFNIWKNSNQENQRDFVVDFGTEKYFNPGYSQVRTLIINGIEEIVKNYEVDGIQFDDYFYPENRPEFDQKCYEDYLKSLNGQEPLSKEKWRMTNVNSLIAGVYSTIKNIKPSVLFGISPSCNLKNNEQIGADVRSWSQISGYVDYICPQVYVNFENPILPFDKALDDWKNIVDRKVVKLYHGLGVYKAGSDMDKGTWKGSDNILQKEIELARQSGTDGFILFSYGSLFNPQAQNEVLNLMKALSN